MEVANIAKGDSIWIQEFLVKTLRVPIQLIFRHYMRLQESNPAQCFEQCLALMLLWAKIIKGDDSSELIGELRMHGVPLYRDVFVNLCTRFLSRDNIMMLAKH